MRDIFFIFTIVACGYLLGCIKVKGIQLGTSVVLIVALIAGHFGVFVPPLMRNLGLMLFVCAVGLMAGPVFFRNLKKEATFYMLMGFTIIISGALSTVLLSKLFRTPGPLAVGLMNGALTSTPGLAAALDVSNDPTVSVGYGVAYLFGVLGVVLYVQLLPRILHKDIVKEAQKFSCQLRQNFSSERRERYVVLESSGLMIFSFVMVLGALLGMISIPIKGGGHFSLGATGGPLFMGIIVGHFSHAGKISLEIPPETLSVLREFGLVLFLVGAGTQAGTGFVEVVSRYGFLLFLEGAVITLIPMILGTFLALKIFKMDLVPTLGSICGGMTSTPALGTLIVEAETEDVSIAYAATYPAALILIVLLSQFLISIL